MVYKLAEEDKLCGVIYPTYEGFKPIPKATCEMLESKCDKVVVEINCKDKEKKETPSEDLDTSLNSLYLGKVSLEGGKIASINSIISFNPQGTPLIEDKLQGQANFLKGELEKDLNKRNNTDKYKVNSFTVTMLKHVGDNAKEGDPIFSYTTTIVKPNGEVVTKEGMLHSYYVKP